MTRSRSHLLSITLLVLSCSTWLLTATSASTSPDCPPPVNSVLASADYRTCQQAFTTGSVWVLSDANADTLNRIGACKATLQALVTIDFDVCVTSIAASDSPLGTRVVVEKASLEALATSHPNASRHSLRHGVTRLLQTTATSGDSSSTSFNYNYVYGGVAIFVVVLLVSCICSRGQSCCFCIPIPICC